MGLEVFDKRSKAQIERLSSAARKSLFLWFYIIYTLTPPPQPPGYLSWIKDFRITKRVNINARGPRILQIYMLGYGRV
jgi:hypothetical protein